MVYTDAKYTSPEQTGIKVLIDGQQAFVPCVEGNRHYAEIMGLVAAGELQIAEYVAPPPPPPVEPSPSLSDLLAQIQALQAEIEALKAG